MTAKRGNNAQGGKARRGATTRGRSGAVQTRRNQRDWRRGRRQQPLGGQGGKGRRGEQHRGEPSKAAQNSNMGKRSLAGATLGKPPPQTPTRRECRAAMGRGQHKGGETEAGGENMPEKPRECRVTTGAQGLWSDPQVPQSGGRGRGTRGLPSGGKPTGVPQGSGRGSRVATG